MTDPSDKKIQWFVGKSGSIDTLLGPFTEDEVLGCLSEGKISWADGAWNASLDRQWRRITDIPVFRRHFPPLPPASLLASASGQAGDGGAAGKSVETQATQTARVEPGGRVWYLNFEGSEFGPLNVQEVQEILRRGKLEGKLTAWAEGLPDWTDLDEIDEFKGLLGAGVADLAPDKVERRGHDRKALMATVRFSRIRRDGKRSPNVYAGLCRDISITGMLVKTSSIPRSLGMVVQLDVQPMNVRNIPTFTVEGEVVRVLEEHGFAVRFTNLSDELRESIQKFAASDDALAESSEAPATGSDDPEDPSSQPAPK